MTVLANTVTFFHNLTVLANTVTLLKSSKIQLRSRYSNSLNHLKFDKTFAPIFKQIFGNTRFWQGFVICTPIHAWNLPTNFKTEKIM